MLSKAPAGHKARRGRARSCSSHVTTPAPDPVPTHAVRTETDPSLRPSRAQGALATQRRPARNTPVQNMRAAPAPAAGRDGLCRKNQAADANAIVRIRFYDGSHLPAARAQRKHPTHKGVASPLTLSSASKRVHTGVFSRGGSRDDGRFPLSPPPFPMAGTAAAHDRQYGQIPLYRHGLLSVIVCSAGLMPQEPAESASRKSLRR